MYYSFTAAAFPLAFFFSPPIYFTVFLEDGDLNFYKKRFLQKQQQLKSAFVVNWREKKSTVCFPFTVA